MAGIGIPGALIGLIPVAAIHFVTHFSLRDSGLDDGTAVFQSLAILPNHNTAVVYAFHTR